jgi:magnesium-transporting ATPase (P-type)
MADDLYSPRPVARWYMIAAIASVLFTVAACALYLQHVTTNPAALPLDQRTAFEAMPLWVISAFGLSAVAGLVASLMLVFRRKLAQPLMLVSLLAMVAWLAGLFLLPGVRETSSSNDLAVAIVVAAIDWTIFWFARHSAQRGWLR